MLRKLTFIALLSVFGMISAQAQARQNNADTVLVLPFENTSGKSEFNWVGESFADALTDLLRVPNLNVVPNEGRKLVQQRLRIPLSSLPSLATSLKLARDTNASLLVSGKYSIIPAQGDTAATISVKARVIKVNEGRYLSEEHDGKLITREITLTDALGNLQTMQGQIAYHVLLQRNPSLEYSQNAMVIAATKVPARAFEAYIKGLLTPAAESREIYFRNAMRLYTETIPDGTYPEAALELGHLYLNQNKTNEAIESFERVVYANQQCKEKAKAENKPVRCGDQGYAEASFYIGLIHWKKGNYEPALAVLRPLAEDLKLTSVYNALGAIAVQASRAEKKNEARSAALLTEGLDLLKKASVSDPDDLDLKFNYALAEFLHGDTLESAAHLREIVAAKPSDGEAYYILAKALTSHNDASAADIDNQARRFLTAGNRYANLEKEWIKSKTLGDINLRVEQPPRKDFVSVVLSNQPATSAPPALNQTDTSLAEARKLFQEGNDDEAMAVLRRVLAGEPMSAESYLILGKIHLRRGDLEQAISSFKTAIFWDNRLIDAYVSLGRIYVEKGDCLQAKNYAVSAAELDAENQDVVGLQRQTERCSK